MGDDMKLYNLKEVAEILKVSRQSVYNYIGAGKLKASKLNRQYRVSEAQLKEFLEEPKDEV